MNNSNTNLGLGILAGTVIGATLGILFAPDKGANTRKKIVEESIAAKNKIAEGATNVKETIVEKAGVTKNNLNDHLDVLVSDASYKAEDVITSLEKKLGELKIKNKKLQKS